MLLHSYAVFFNLAALRETRNESSDRQQYTGLGVVICDLSGLLVSPLLGPS